MIDALGTSSFGAMTALSKNREQDSAEKAEAVRLGKSVDSDAKLESKVREVAEEFVSVFMNQVMRSMRSTVQENPAMHGDNGEKFFQDLLDTEYSKNLARGTGYGLTDLIYESMMTSYRVTRKEDMPNPGDSLMDAVGQPEDSEDPVAVGGIA